MKPVKKLVLPVVLLAGCLAGFLLVILPQGRRLFGKIKRAQVVTGEVKALEDKLTVLDGYDNDALAEQLTVLAEAVPVDNNFASIFSAVDAITLKSGVTVTDMSLTSPATAVSTGSAKLVGKEEKRLGANILYFTVAVQGNLSQLREFFEQVNLTRRILKAERFSIAKTQAGTGLLAQVEMVGYYAPLSQQKAQTTDPLETLTTKQETLLTKLSTRTPTASPAVLPGPVTGPVRANPFSL